MCKSRTNSAGERRQEGGNLLNEVWYHSSPFSSRRWQRCDLLRTGHRAGAGQTREALQRTRAFAPHSPPALSLGRREGLRPGRWQGWPHHVDSPAAPGKKAGASVTVGAGVPPRLLLEPLAIWPALPLTSTHFRLRTPLTRKEVTVSTKNINSVPKVTQRKIWDTRILTWSPACPVITHYSHLGEQASGTSLGWAAGSPGFSSLPWLLLTVSSGDSYYYPSENLSFPLSEMTGLIKVPSDHHGGVGEIRLKWRLAGRQQVAADTEEAISAV